jgi:hypothetical protein
MTIATTHDPRELAHRSSDGIEVWLFWSPDDDRLFVRCVDGRVEDAFELDIRPADALDAFEHPYAYAAFRGVDYCVPQAQEARVAGLIR